MMDVQQQLISYGTATTTARREYTASFLAEIRTLQRQLTAAESGCRSTVSVDDYKAAQAEIARLQHSCESVSRRFSELEAQQQ